MRRLCRCLTPLTTFREVTPLFMTRPEKGLACVSCKCSNLENLLLSRNNCGLCLKQCAGFEPSVFCYALIKGKASVLLPALRTESPHPKSLRMGCWKIISDCISKNTPLHSLPQRFAKTSLILELITTKRTCHDSMVHINRDKRTHLSLEGSSEQTP